MENNPAHVTGRLILSSPDLHAGGGCRQTRRTPAQNPYSPRDERPGIVINVEVGMTTVFHRAPRAKLPIAVAGDGIEIVDSEGKRYIDASGGAAVSCLGHSNQRVIDAIKRQAQQLAYAHTSFFTTEPAEALADWLVEHAPQGLSHVYF